MAIHVDDLLLAGSGAEFEKAVRSLESRLPFGARKYSTPTTSTSSSTTLRTESSTSSLRASSRARYASSIGWWARLASTATP
eukprot:3892433-Alexandrium_andersonii.AAC.1